MPYSQTFGEPFILRLPYPYLTTYELFATSSPGTDGALLKLRRTAPAASSLPEGLEPVELHSNHLCIIEPHGPAKDAPPDSNNTEWARARRSPLSIFQWPDSNPPTMGQLWLAIYAVLERWPELEQIRLDLRGRDAASLNGQLCTVMLAIRHPAPGSSTKNTSTTASAPTETLILRSTFWQGAGSPFGTRPPWLPELPFNGPKPLSMYPPMPLSHTQTSTFSSSPVHTLHLRRPQKPHPGSVIYSRWIPHLCEHFSMVALDVANPGHVDLFHRWQNDPRVAQGWNESGTLEQHVDYLSKMHNDPHAMAVLAKFDDTCFAYFEIYWAQEDPLGAYHNFLPHDRGRHSLVGDVRFRGRHRVTAWWSALLHYIFLDEPRTTRVVGEPRATNATVLAYDFANGFGLLEWIDLPHKRAALMACPRERFFQLCPMAFDGVVKGPDGLGPMAARL